MALKEQDVVFTTKDARGNTVIQMPITRVENVEGALKTVNNLKPDENGNIEVVIVKKVNGIAPDSSGNVVAGNITYEDIGSLGVIDLEKIDGLKYVEV